ncbi:DUF4129 domain-containing protein [Natronorubrum daqingense]|uniref:Protein-glutamine gamma-glutamyltransferase-like C-terminal domain-containing protein n=1 Tax=Natronorubrum daqingense TaxID=588898 RepID=A0A1P8RCV9_9EURY|nr:DUF4129 domain-containing protein [Natronorubrum daqingense]APX96476.1 hypothetical protein BB347_07520 [Natronorubrum daqingense]
MTDSLSIRRIAIACCAIVATALVAATIRTPLESGSDGSGSGSDPGDGEGTGQPMTPGSAGDGGVPPFLEYLIYAVLIVLAIAVVWYFLAHRREAVKIVAITLLAVFLLVVIVYTLLQFVSVSGSEVEPMEEVLAGGDDESDGTSGSADTDTTISPGPLLVTLALLTAIFLGGVFLTRGRSESERSGLDANSPTDAESPADVSAAVGTAAGVAADRLESADEFDNEVYRAWREMTEFLEVDRPASSTPREFARAATDAGLDRDDVDELTRLFEDVRYGGEATTQTRERRAIEVLRRIEAEYADEREGADTRGGRGELS